LTATATGSPTNWTWTSSCGGTFSPDLGNPTTWTPPSVDGLTPCDISVEAINPCASCAATISGDINDASACLTRIEIHPRVIDLGIVLPGMKDSLPVAISVPPLPIGPYEIVIQEIGYSSPGMSMFPDTAVMLSSPDTLLRWIAYEASSCEPFSGWVKVFSSAKQNPVDSIEVRVNGDCVLFEKGLEALLNHASLTPQDSTSVDDRGNGNGHLDLGDLIAMLKGADPAAILTVLGLSRPSEDQE